MHPGWLGAIDEVARARFGPADRVGPELAALVAGLSAVYNRRSGRLRDQEAAHIARLRFFLPRDLPKIGGPLAELAFAEALPPGPVWNVLDLGAGLGTTGLGVASFARGIPGVERVEITAVERDGRALAIYGDLAARAGHGVLADAAVPLTLHARTGDLEALSVEGTFDLIVVGLALNELFATAADPVGARAAWLGAVGRRLAPGGSLIVIEPALREVTRLLMAVRDRVVAGEVAGLHVFGPCTHAAACPLRAIDRDWCHDVRSAPLPAPLQPIAREAGLRFERLTWSALTLRTDDRRLAPGAWRVVGGPLASKGKTEWTLCGDGRTTRLTRLDRNRGADPIGDAERGAILELEGEVGEAVRADRVEVRRIR